MNERDEILKNNRDQLSVSSAFPKRSSAGFLIGFILRNTQAFSRFIHKWGKP